MTAEEIIHPSVFPEVDSKPVDGKTVMVITIGRGIATPYTNNRGEVYVKRSRQKALNRCQ